MYFFFTITNIFKYYLYTSNLCSTVWKLIILLFVGANSPRTGRDENFLSNKKGAALAVHFLPDEGTDHHS